LNGGKPQQSTGSGPNASEDARLKFTPFGQTATGKARGSKNAEQRLDHIAHLLSKGRDAEAIRYAAAVAFLEYVDQTERTTKAHFNPAEPREPDAGRWTKDGGENSPKGLIELVQYRGHFHDAVVDQILIDLKTTGHLAAKDIRILGLNGILAKPDIGTQGPDAPVLKFLEVKTGFDPPLTPNQKVVYPLTCIGGHVTSFDPRITEFGFKMGMPLPSIDIFLVRTLGPGMPITSRNWCREMGLRP
jgi:hypothetical protein